MRAATAFLIFLAGQAVAEEAGAPIRLDAEAFRALTEGRVAHFSAFGELYGSEGYLDNDQSVWRDAQGDCRDGFWWEEGESLCFQYESVSCWKVFRETDGSFFAISDADGLRVNFEAFQDGPLECSAPFVELR